MCRSRKFCQGAGGPETKLDDAFSHQLILQRGESIPVFLPIDKGGTVGPPANLILNGVRWRTDADDGPTLNTLICVH